MSKKVISFIFISFLILLVFTVCTKRPDPIDIQNVAPETYLCNVPLHVDTTVVPPDSTTYIYHARVLFWYGTDEDGIVARFDWAIDDTSYNDTILGSGWHSLYMDSTLATQDTIAFAAPLPDTIYSHTFYVRAVDNKDLVDATPASRVFNTSNITPNTRFISTPKDSSQRFILSDTTNLWKGINFEWTAIDSDKVFPCQFQYCWNDTTIDFDPVTHEGWSKPVSEESFYFTGQNAPMTEAYHTLYIRAFDDAGAIDPSLSDTIITILEADTISPDSIVIIDADTTVYNQWRTVYFVVPEIGENPDFRKLLWVNLTSGWANNNIVKPFYHSILDDSIGLAYDSLDYSIDECNHSKLGDYSTIIWSRGNKDGSPTSLADKQELITDFLHIGGRVIFTGSWILKTGNYGENTSFGIKKPFPFSELHINKYKTFSAGSSTDTTISPVQADTAFFSEDYTLPFVSLNESILWYFIWNNFMVEVLNLDLWGDYDGNLDIIYTVNHYRDNANYERKSCATRFTYSDKSTPSFFYFGFPISYLEYGKATQLMRTILTELGEIP